MSQIESDDFELLSRREMLRGSYLRIALVQFDNLEGEQAIALCYDVLRIEPLSEIFYQKLMIIYRDDGRTDLASATYEQCRRIFQSELGVEPSIDSRRIIGLEV